MNRLRILDIPADRLEGDAVAAFFFEDERPVRGPAALIDWRLNGLLTGMLRQGTARGGAGEQILALGNGKLASAWAVFAGGGCWRGLDRANYARLIGDLLTSCRRAGFTRTALCLSPLDGMEAKEMEGLVATAIGDSNAADCVVSVVPRRATRISGI